MVSLRYHILTPRTVIAAVVVSSKRGSSVGLVHVELDRKERIGGDPKPAGNRVGGAESPPTFLPPRAKVWATIQYCKPACQQVLDRIRSLPHDPARRDPGQNLQAFMKRFVVVAIVIKHKKGFKKTS